MKQDWCNIPVSMPWQGSDHFTKLLTWLKDNIDERDWDWDVPHDKGIMHRVFYFAHKKDAVWFALKWS